VKYLNIFDNPGTLASRDYCTTIGRESHFLDLQDSPEKLVRENLALRQQLAVLNRSAKRPVPSINSSALKCLGFSDTTEPHEFFDHTGTPVEVLGNTLLASTYDLSGMRERTWAIGTPKLAPPRKGSR